MRSDSRGGEKGSSKRERERGTVARERAGVWVRAQVRVRVGVRVRVRGRVVVKIRDWAEVAQVKVNLFYTHLGLKERNVSTKISKWLLLLRFVL